jgi:hypothetical protein
MKTTNVTIIARSSMPAAPNMPYMIHEFLNKLLRKKKANPPAVSLVAVVNILLDVLATIVRH